MPISVSDAAGLVPPEWARWVARLEPDGGPGGADWAAGVPRLLAEALERWDLVVDGAARTGWTAIVLPVRRDGRPLALKVVWPHPEALAEPLALRLWAGRGAVRLVAADPGAGALLLERLDPDRTLEDRAVDTDTACAVIGSLLADLHVPAPPNVLGLKAFIAPHLHGPRGLDTTDRLPRRAVDRALGLAEELLARPDAEATLLHADLHYANVLAPLDADRGDWLAIDPKPVAGHPGVELHPLLRNRNDELGTGRAFRWSVRRRLEVACEAAGIDEDLARHWAIVHSTIEAMWATRGADADEGEVGFELALAKALDD